jgi:segregation and condensation protein B
MTPGDSTSHEATPKEGGHPSSLSVDQLTQAFAQLMGNASGADASPNQSTMAAIAGAAPIGGPLEDELPEDERQVTPAAVLEAVLFIGHPENEPLTNRRMASYLRGVSPQEVDQLIEQLNQQYDQQGAPYRIISEGPGYRMALRDQFARLRDSFYGRVRQARLSQVAVDLLAIVAYHQPISRDDIDRLRGQPSGPTLSQLVRRQLLQVTCTQDQRRQKIYRTTDRFLVLFGLDSLEDLPSHEEI